jgi:hypothetical protein
VAVLKGCAERAIDGLRNGSEEVVMRHVLRGGTFVVAVAIRVSLT